MTAPPGVDILRHMLRRTIFSAAVELYHVRRNNVRCQSCPAYTLLRLSCVFAAAVVRKTRLYSYERATKPGCAMSTGYHSSTLVLCGDAYEV